MSDYQKMLIPEDDGVAYYLKNKTILYITLPNQEGNPLQLKELIYLR